MGSDAAGRAIKVSRTVTTIAAISNSEFFSAIYVDFHRLIGDREEKLKLLSPSK
jgi:hypothetical protein